MKQTTNFNEYNIVGDDSSLTINNSSGSLVSFTNGNIGIGTISPTEKFEVNEGFIRSTGSSIYHGFELARDSFPTYQIKHLDGGLTIYNSTDNRKEMSFFGDGRVGINGGNVGIGTISPTEKLEVNEGYIRSTGLSTSHGFELARDNSPTYQIKHLDGGLTIFNLNATRKEMTFKGNGRIGINNSNPIETLDVIGNIKADGILKLFDVTNTQTIELNPNSDSYLLGDLIIGDSNTNRTVKLTDDGLYISRTDDGEYTSQIKANSNSNHLDISARSSIYFKHNDESVISLTLYDYGHVQMPTYGQGNVSGVTQYVLGVSSNGTIIESEWLTNDSSSSSIRIGKGIPSVFEKSYVTLIGNVVGGNGSVINNFNTLIGGLVGYDSGTFVNNTIIGNAAAYFGNNYKNSVIIGEQAGQQIGLNKSVAIGYRNAYSTQPQGSFNNTITIGSEVTPTADGQIIIGNNDNTFFETFGQIKNSSYGQGNVLSDFVTDETSLPVFDANGNLVESQVISINNGNVGIGTATPTEKLEVDGNIKITSGGNTFFNINHGNVGAIIFKDISISTPNEWVIQHNYSQLNDFRIARFIGGDDFVIDNNGNVGINTTSPVEKLDVIGNIKADGILKLFDVTDTQIIELNPDGDSYINGGNVGIGTTNPRYNLEVAGTLAVFNDLYIGHDNGSNPIDAGSIYFRESGATWGTNFFGFRINQQGSSNFLNFQAANNTTIRDILTLLRDTGNVGINTTSPTEKLDVIGNIKADGILKLFDVTDTQTIELNPDGDSYINGNLGIGTTTPSKALDIVAINGQQFRLTQTTADNTKKNAYINLRHYNNSENDFTMMLGNSDVSSNSLNIGGGTTIGNSATVLRFYTAENNTTTVGTVRMLINSSGNVGIGTSNPSQKLDIIGLIRLSNTDSDLEIKLGYNLLRHYDNSKNDISIYTSSSNSGGNSITIGGGSTLFNSATSISFNTATNNNTINGSTRMLINYIGNVGINTTIPTEKLDVIGNIKADGILKLFDVTDTQTIELNPDGDSYINSGNVGIGTTSPTERLDVVGSINASDRYKIEDDTILRYNSVQESIYVGLNSGYESNGDTYRSAGVGIGSLNFNTGDNSNAFGRDALRNNTGNFSNGFGNYSLFSNTGQLSNGFGHSALQYNTGINSNGFGYTSLQNNTGQNSNGFGYDSLRNNVGSYANGFGNNVLRENTGNFASGFGHSSLLNNTGDNVSAFGYVSLQNNTGHTSNGFGYGSLQNNTGDNSNGFGYASLQNNTGNYSSAFGHNTLLNNSGAYNTAFGHQSGYSETVLTGGNNTFLGAGSTYATSSITNSTAVGAGITLTNSNTVILGSGNSQKVGIGTTNPYMRLHVGAGQVSTILHNGEYLDTSASAKFVSDTPYVRNGILIGVNDGTRNSRLELYTKDDIAGNGEHGIRTGYSSGGLQPFRIYNNSSDAAFEIDSVGQKVKLPQYGSGNITGTSTQLLGVDSDGTIVEESVDTFQRIEKLSGTLTNSFVTIKTLSLSTMDMYKMVVIGLGPDITLRQAALATYVARVEADGGVVESQDYVEVELGDLLDTTNYIRSYAEYLIYNEDGVGYALEELNSNLRSEQLVQPLIRIDVDALQIKNGLNINNSIYRVTLTKYD